MVLHVIAKQPTESTTQWLLEGDPSVRWQVLRDLVGTSPTASCNPIFIPMQSLACARYIMPGCISVSPGNQPANFERLAMAESRGNFDYLHGTEPQEQQRLSRMNDLLNERSMREMALQPGDRVLDVGSGLGQLTRGIARHVKPTLVVGIERDDVQLAEARRLASQAGEQGVVDFRKGEATQLPLRDDEWDTFDIAHARFVLEHVPDPLSVVREMVRAVKPGGRIILEDDSHDIFRLWPEPPGFGRLWQCYLRSYDRMGNDPFVGHRLVSLLHAAGAAPERNTWLFFGACAGQPKLFTAHVDNLVEVLRGARRSILNLGELEPASFDQCLMGIRTWSARPDAALWYATSWAEGRKLTACPVSVSGR